MKTITFALQKGGTGKTSCSVSCAVELAKKYKVIFIDADPQGNASAWIGPDKIAYELSDVLTGKTALGQAICQTEVPNLFLLPTAGIGGSLREYQQSSKAMTEPYAIADLLPELGKIFDFCVIDTSPAFGAIERAAFAAADEVIPVLQLNQFSLDGLQIFTTNLASAKKSLRLGDKPVLNKIILNGRDERIAQQNENLKMFEQMAGNISLFILPTDQSYSKAQKVKLPIQILNSSKKETFDTLTKLAEAIAK